MPLDFPGLVAHLQLTHNFTIEKTLLNVKRNIIHRSGDFVTVAQSVTQFKIRSESVNFRQVQ